jgi:hypothetical protein
MIHKPAGSRKKSGGNKSTFAKPYSGHFFFSKTSNYQQNSTWTTNLADGLWHQLNYLA